jgi:hypothetical protein
MIIRVVSGSSLRVVEIEDVSQIVVMTSAGDPCVVARDLQDGTVIAGHAAEPDFPKLLKQAGMVPRNPITKV